MMTNNNQLLPNRHPGSDLFFCDIADAVVKDDMASMEHPIFVLTKQPYMKRKRYQNGNNWLEVVPSANGIANIYDKDILIYAVSQIMAAKNVGKPYSKHISFTAYDFLVFSNRNIGGKEYKALRESLERLSGTRLLTNIRTGDEEQLDGFGIIDKFRIRRKHLDGRVIEWGITLSDWLFNAIEANEVLTLNPDYFRLRKPLERRIYEIARKHCGTKKEWYIGIEKLQEKCGSTSTKNHFKRMIKNISSHQHLPDYHVEVINDTVLFIRTGQVGKVKIMISGQSDYSKIPPLKPSTFEKFKKIYSNYDPYFIEQEWRNWAQNKEAPKSPDAAFLAFAKSYVKLHPM